LAVRCFAYDVDVVGQAELHAQTVAQQRLVVADADADRHVVPAGRTGSWASTHHPSAVAPMRDCPPAVATLVRMPSTRRPPRSAALCARDPADESTTTRSTPSVEDTRTVTIAPGACLTTLVRASWTMRYTHSCTSVGTCPASGTSSAVTATPAARTLSTSVAMSASPGGGASDDATGPDRSRSTPS